MNGQEWRQRSISLGIIVLIAVTVVPGFSAADNFDAIKAYNSGIDLANAGKYQEALGAFNTSLEENQNFTLALISRAGVLTLLGRNSEALTDTGRALALNNSSADAWINRGQALLNLNRVEEALSAAERALASEPANAGGWLVKARSLVALGRIDDAKSAYDQALALLPGDPVITAERQAVDLPAGRKPVTAAETVLPAGTVAPSKAPLSPACTLVAVLAAALYLSRHKEV